MIEKKIYKLAKKLWGYNRSITGEGSLNSLKKLKNIFPELKILSVKSGLKVYDWKVPKEWNVKEAYIINPDKKKILDFKKNNLHLVSYSVKIKKTLKLNQLKKHLHTLKKQPSAIPYVTSYYKKNWGFCIKHNQYKKLKKGYYKVNIDTSFKNGKLNFGEIIIKGKSKDEIFFSTYICHPSMANNELAGPCLMIYIADWIKKNHDNYHTIRIVFIPETIGSLVYLNKNFKKLKKNMKAGFNITCIGDNREYSYMSSRNGNTNSDNIIKYVLKNITKKYKCYSWNERGSDERNYCAPGVDLPVATVMRSKFGSYPEYHTSLDKLGTVVTKKSLKSSFDLIKKIVIAADNNCYPKTKIFGEPFMTKRNMYPTTSKTHSHKPVKTLMDIISYCDGSTSLISISEKCKKPISVIMPILNKLKKKKIVNF